MFYGSISKDTSIFSVSVDPDSTLTAALLHGLIPDQGIEALVKVVGLFDVDPLRDRTAYGDAGAALMLWHLFMRTHPATSTSTLTHRYQVGVGMWEGVVNLLLSGRASQFALPLMEEEHGRVRVALEDLNFRSEEHGRVLLVKESRVFGFPEWYGRVPLYGPEEVRGWKHPVVVAWVQKTRRVTLGCPNKAVAEPMFRGAGGLMNVFSRLLPAGWGGREAIGGSPQGKELDYQDVLDATRMVDACVQQFGSVAGDC